MKLWIFKNGLNVTEATFCIRYSGDLIRNDPAFIFPGYICTSSIPYKKTDKNPWDWDRYILKTIR